MQKKEFQKKGNNSVKMIFFKDNKKEQFLFLLRRIAMSLKDFDDV
jgi:hypothetical protein